MKRLIAILLAATLLLSACTATPGTDDPTAENQITPIPTEATTGEAKDENIVIVDEEGITITYKRMELIQYADQSDAYGLYITFGVENNSPFDITIYPQYGESSVNDVMKMMTSGMPQNTLSGKKSTATFFFGNLEDTGIDSVNDVDKIEKVEFRLLITGESVSDVIFETDTITITP